MKIISSELRDFGKTAEGVVQPEVKLVYGIMEIDVLVREKGEKLHVSVWTHAGVLFIKACVINSVDL